MSHPYTMSMFKSRADYESAVAQYEDAGFPTVFKTARLVDADGVATFYKVVAQDAESYMDVDYLLLENTLYTDLADWPLNARKWVLVENCNPVI